MRVLAVVVLLLLAGCASHPPTDGSWKLVSATDSAGSFSADGVTIALAGEAYNGKAPCNSYTGTLYSGFTTTEVACPALDLEQRYYAALGSVDEATLVNGLLRLSGGGAVLEFEPA